MAAAGGAAGVVYTLRAVERRTARELVVCVTTVCAVGVVLTLLSGWASGTLHPASVQDSPLTAAYWFFLYLPAVFVVEEVFFRGVLDTYLHALDAETGWFSATFLSMLWGLWHRPITLAPGRSLVIVGLIVVQIALGVPLSMGSRRSGSLLVPGVAHALNDAIRNVLVGLP